MATPSPAQTALCIMDLGLLSFPWSAVAYGLAMLCLRRRPLFGALLCLALLLEGYRLHHAIDQPAGQRLEPLTLAACVVWLSALLLTICRSFSQLGAHLWYGVLPMAILAALALPPPYPSDPRVHVAHDPHLLLHIGVALVAGALFLLNALQTIFLMIHNDNIRHHRSSAISLPPLLSMERQWWSLSLASFVALSAVLLPALWNNFWGNKTFPSLLAWTILAATLWGHRFEGFRGRKALRWVFLGLLIVLGILFWSRVSEHF